MRGERELSLLDRFSHIKYPDNLDKQDKKLILQQCDIQGDLFDESITNFAIAYAEAKEFASDKSNRDNLTANHLEELILRWAAQIEPKHNAKKRNTRGYRDTPVVFSDGRKGIGWEAIERRVNLLCKFATELFDANDPDRITADEFYREIQEIHPFEDGNGRIGDLLWKLIKTRDTGEWPQELPPNIFGEDRSMLDESD